MLACRVEGVKLERTLVEREGTAEPATSMYRFGHTPIQP